LLFSSVCSFFFFSQILKTKTQFGTRESATYDIFSNGMKAVLSLKAKGRRSSIAQFRAKQQPGLGFFEINIKDQGSIGLVLAMSNAGYPIVRADPDTSVHNGATSMVQSGDVVHKINGKHTEGSSFGAIVEKLRRNRPLCIEFVRPTNGELRARFYGQPKQMKNPSVGALKNVKWGDEEDAISGDGGMHSSVDRNGKSRKKKKEKMKKKVRR
jgi:hypothetical protein